MKVSAPRNIDPEYLVSVSADASKRGVQLRTELASGLPGLLCDRTQIQQVLLNLIVNGMHAMENVPQGQRVLIVQTKAAGDGVGISVIDSGTGIPEERLPLLFDSFYTTRPDGMGLGLSIARTIVAAHHGRITASNNPQGGATFCMTLPLKQRT